MNHLSKKSSQLAIKAMLAAISVVLLLLLQVPLFPAAPFLKYDMADVPVLIATMFLGPVAGLQVLALVCIIQAMFLGGDGLVGFLMHFVASGAFVLLAGYIYNRKKTTGSLVTALVVGSLAMTIMMIPMNYIFTVGVYGVPLEAMNAMVFPVIIPFNLLKAGINSLILFVSFKAVKRIFAKHQIINTAKC